MALEKEVASKIAAAQPTHVPQQQGGAQYIRYTPSQQGQSYNSGAKQRVIRMVETQKDPMEPPRFKYKTLNSKCFTCRPTILSVL